MRTVFGLLLVACSVPDKHPATDGGGDVVPPDGSNDLSAPNTRITDAPSEFSRDGAGTFAFDSDDAAATFQCSIDHETQVACTSPYTRTLGDGQHGFVVRAIDAAGNADDSPAEHQWTIDRVAPETTITGKPPLADNSVFVTFDFDSNEDNVSFECSLDNAAFGACVEDAQVGPLSDGPHAFSVRAHDRAGNFDMSPVVYAWSVDTSTPDTQILSGPADTTPLTTATFTFVSPDAGSGATFQCSLDAAAFVACTSSITYSNLPERLHTFAVRVRDAVGNLDPTPATRAWTVDLTPPNTTITGGPAGVVPSASATFTFTSSEQDASFECRVDTAAFAACTSPYTVMLAQGAHTFAVRAIDGAGHVDASPATAAWTVDTVMPDVTITAGPANGSTSGPRVEFAFTTTEGALQCSLDAAPFAACTSPFAFNAPPGMHSFTVHATDAAGNVGIETRTWTIACAAPTVAGAAGLLHLDDTGQALANAVAGGIAATLGDDLTVEPDDPAPGAGRFGGGLAFAAFEVDHVAWPVALGPTTAFTVELWSLADAAAGTHAILASGDGRLAVRVTAASPTTVRYTVEVVETGIGGKTQIAMSAPVAAGVWHHVLASLQEPTLRLWVDGVRTDVAGVALGTALALDALDLGKTYSGSLDEIWLAQTAISTDDMALLRYCPL